MHSLTCTVCVFCLCYLLLHSLECSREFSLSHQQFNFQYVSFKNDTCIRRLPDGLELAQKLFGNEKVTAAYQILISEKLLQKACRMACFFWSSPMNGTSETYHGCKCNKGIVKT
jgi:hypothetical protein